MDKRTPIGVYVVEGNEATDPTHELAWVGLLDKRYKLEVQRIAPYSGVLCIFDSYHDSELLFEKEVSISFDARFGADVGDVAEWQAIGIEFVDGRNKV